MLNWLKVSNNSFLSSREQKPAALFYSLRVDHSAHMSPFNPVTADVRRQQAYGQTGLITQSDSDREAASAERESSTMSTWQHPPAALLTLSLRWMIRVASVGFVCQGSPHDGLSRYMTHAHLLERLFSVCIANSVRNVWRNSLNIKWLDGWISWEKPGSF